MSAVKLVMLLCLAVGVLFVPVSAFSGILDPCSSQVWVTSDLPPDVPPVYFACPEGDTPRLDQQGFVIHFFIKDFAGNPIAGIPPSDFWLIGNDPNNELALCAASASSDADSVTNDMGQTTMSGVLTVGGCSEGLAAVVQGYAILDPSELCVVPYNLPLYVHSPDFNGDLEVNLIDLSMFSQSWRVAWDRPNCMPNCPGDIGGYLCRGCTNNCGTCDPCVDLNGDDLLGLQDLSRLARPHYGPPGHRCL